GNFLAQHLTGTLGHVREEGGSGGLARTFEGDGQASPVGRRKQRLNAGGVEPGEIIESEHQGADFLPGARLSAFKCGQEDRLGARIEPVENARNALVPAPPCACGKHRQPPGEIILDAFQR
ncbi:hypothetical protein RZS08_56630, partial [Arthrospira platensis SPKY1]|nr:hypothetical protein [Arthrospira platensis SPKY1]